jgi:carbon-monoxide dehydrogenase medium subunit
MLSEAASNIGDAQVRNCGTIGGNVAHADPASDLPTVLAALDARFNVTGAKGERTIGAADFFQGMMSTALGTDEILTSIEVPAKKAGQGMAYVKFSHPASRYAVLGVAAVVTMQNGSCGSAQVAIGGLVPAPARLRDVEGAVAGAKPSAEAAAKAAAAASSQLGDDILGDVYASAEYRKAMAPVYVKRALTAAFERAS